MVQLVAAGHAVALLPRAVVQAGIEGGILRVIAAKPLIAPRTYYVSYLGSERGLDDGALVRMAREVLMRTGLLIPL
jgi:DNA-binding transcriptional LysR family regulator